MWRARVDGVDGAVGRVGVSVAVCDFALSVEVALEFGAVVLVFLVAVGYGVVVVPVLPHDEVAELVDFGVDVGSGDFAVDKLLCSCVVTRQVRDKDVLEFLHPPLAHEVPLPVDPRADWGRVREVPCAHLFGVELAKEAS